MKKPKQIGMGLDLRGSQSELRWEDKHWDSAPHHLVSLREWECVLWFFISCNQLYKLIFLFLTVQYGTSCAILYYICPGNVLAACMHDDNWLCIRWHLWQHRGHPDHIWELKHCNSEPCPSGIQVSCLSACLKRTDALISRGAFIGLFSLSCNIVGLHLLDALNIAISLQKADRLKIWLPISALPT